MRELRIWYRAQTPRGVGTIAERSEYCDAYRVVIDGVGSHWWDHGDIWPLTPPDIPRERVEALHTVVVKRVEALEGKMTHQGHMADDVHGYPHPRVCLTCSREGHEVEYVWREGDGARLARDMHSELSEVAEALRLLLEVDDAE